MARPDSTRWIEARMRERIDVVVDVGGAGEETVEDLGVLRLDRQHLLPGALVEDELEGERAGGLGFPGHPRELVVVDLPDLDDVVRHPLRDLRHGGASNRSCTGGGTRI